MNDTPGPALEDSRLSTEFRRRLARYMGEYDPTSVFASRYRDWYADHAGRRSQWLRTGLVWRLEGDKPLEGVRVLDFGCGTGSSTVVLAERGARVVGAETEAVSLAIASQRARDLSVADRCALVQIPYITGDDVHLPFEDDAFDVCTLIGVIEHMKPPERIVCLAELHRVLRPGGMLFVFDTPNRAFPRDRHTTQLWFLGWMPEETARRYAIARNRFDARQDFQRYGGQGVSRWRLDRLFPRDQWTVSYEKSIGEVASEYVHPTKTSWLARMARRTVQGLLYACAWMGARPTAWTSSHTIGFTKSPSRPDHPATTRARG